MRERFLNSTGGTGQGQHNEMSWAIEPPLEEWAAKVERKQSGTKSWDDE
jgi:hypothetical protein